MQKYLYSQRTQQILASNRRRADARILREQKHWRGAMYLLGYSIECRLKARLMEMYNTNTLESLEQNLSKKYKKEISLKTHNLEYLFSLTKAKGRLIGPQGDEKNLRAFQRCNRWTTSWRYDPREGNSEECNHFFAAVETFLDFISNNV